MQVDDRPGDAPMRVRDKLGDAPSRSRRPTVLILLGLVLAGAFALALFLPRRPVSLHPEASGICTVVLRGQPVLAVTESRTYVFAGGKDAVYRVDKATLTAEKLPLRTRLNMVRALYALADDDLLIGHQDGLLRWQSGAANRVSETQWTEADGLPDRRVNCLQPGSSGHIWIGTWGGAVTWSDTAGFGSVVRAELHHPMVNAIAEDSRGGIWFAPYNVRGARVTRLTDPRQTGLRQTPQYFGPEQGLTESSVNQILPLGSDRLLFACGYFDHGAAVVLNGQSGVWHAEKTIDSTSGLAGEKARSACLRANGDLLVGSEYDGLAILPGEQPGRVLTTRDGLPHNEVMAMLEDSQGRLWAGTFSGLAILP